MSEPIHLDLTGAQLSFEPLEVGTYDAHVDEVKHGLSEASKEPNLAWAFEVDEEPYEGRKLFLNTSLQPQALWKLGQTLMALGWDEDALTSEGGFELEIEDVLDLPCRIVVTQEEYLGEPRNRIRRVLPPRATEEVEGEELIEAGEEGEGEELDILFA